MNPNPEPGSPVIQTLPPRHTTEKHISSYPGPTTQELPSKTVPVMGQLLCASCGRSQETLLEVRQHRIVERKVIKWSRIQHPVLK